MKAIILGLVATTLMATSAVAQQAGGVAYPSNWAGGPPLPPVGQQYTTYSQTQSYVEYVQPQAVYAQPRVVYAQPQVSYYQPQVTYAQPGAVYYAQRNDVPYSTANWATIYSSGQRVRGQAVQGPPQSRCLVSTLNGTQWQDGCGLSVNITPADRAYLRQKFSRYQPNTGYALNLPSDEDMR